MKRLLQGGLLFIALIVTGNCFGQITSCNFILQDTSVCAPVVLIAIANEVSNSPIVSRTWFLTTCTGTPVYTTPGIGLNSSFSYIISTPGCYCLRVHSVNQNGDTCSYQQCNLNVAASPTLDFVFSPTEGCLPLTVTAQCNSQPGSGTIDSVVIDWGCYGPRFYNYCSSTNPFVAVYDPPICSPGVQSPSIIIRNSFGCYAEQSYPNLINLIPDPIANFTADTTTANCVNSPLLVTFTADSADPHITYKWYINGALVQSDTSRFLIHSFPVDSDCYDIKLVVSHPSGCSDSLTKYGYICVRSSPVIDFTQNSPSVCVNAQHPDSLIFQNTSPGISSLIWQLSSVPAQTFSTDTGARAAYFINTAGTYSITATGSYAYGCTNTVTHQALVTNIRPVAAFTQNDSISCKTPFSVTFSSPTCTGCTYSWSFSGGAPPAASGPVVTSVFNSFVNSSVTLVLTAADGCSDTITKNNDIIIQPIQASLMSTRVMGCAPLCPTFRNTTVLTGLPPSTTISSSCWSFPGSTIAGACQDSLNVCFTQPGCYAVDLVTTTNTGCVDSILVPNKICVANPPNNTLTASPTTICATDSVLFTISGDTISWCKVDFGDGTGIHIFRTPTFSYIYPDTVGTFCAGVVTYRDSCKGDSLIVCITVNAPISKFTDSLTCFTRDTIFLNSQSVGATSYKWHFCNGDSSTLANPFALLPYCDTCVITLITYNSASGCSDKKSQTISTACDSSSLTPVNAQGCAPLEVLFTNTSASIQPGSTIWDFNCPLIVWTGNGTAGGTDYNYIFQNPGSYCVAMKNVSNIGCIDTVYSTVTVCKLTAAFSSNAGCFPAPFCFHDSSLDLSCGQLTWKWYFGDDSTSTLQNPCHTYPAPGTYQAKLVVSSSLGCTDSVTEPAVISSPVHVDFSIDSFVCPGSQNCINNNSTGVDLVYTWIMPGATPDTIFTTASPCFIYPNEGDYPLYLYLSSDSQCNISDTFNIHVHTPVAGGYASSTYIDCPNPPQLITFRDTSQYADTLWHWNFGDNTFSNLQNPSHIYLNAGVYLVTETVTDKNGCTNTAVIDTITVAGPYGTVNYTPSAGGCACQDSVRFIINTSNAVSVILIYGCNTGLAQTIPTPIGSDSVPTSDTFMVGYCIRDTCSTNIIIDDASGCQVFLPNQLIVVDSPNVKIAFNSNGVCYAGTVCFFDSTTYFFRPPLSYTTSRLWYFGDGTTDTAQNPCHYYNQPGNYNVRLFVHSNVGCFDSCVNQTVIIPTLPVVGYYADTSYTCTNQPICFHDTSTTDPATGIAFRVWDFGDGVVDTGYASTICHIYTAAGLYRVKLCVHDSLGCSNCDSSTAMNVIANPSADAGGNQVVCYGAIAQLNGSGGNNYHWTPPGLFSNPNISNPTVLLYTDTVVMFTVSNSFGCTNTDTISLSLAKVNANFNVGRIFCSGNAVCVSDTSTGINDSIISYEYYFGVNAHYVSGRDNCYIYPAPGSYDITLIDIDNHGCTDTITKPVLILALPHAAFSVSDTVICSYQQICLTDLSTGTAQITNWLWNYGDNSGSSLSSPPCHTYTAPFMHNYTISLIVTDQNNCSDSVAIVETVNRIPQASFNWDTSCENKPMPLVSTSLPGDGAIISCQWTLWLGANNPVIDSNCTTSFMFPPGLHNVQLVVGDANGCFDTIVQPVATDSLTTLTVTPGDTTICLGTSVNYEATGVFNVINWINNIWLSSNNQRVVTINPLGDVTYVVNAKSGVCAALSDSFTISVIQPVSIEVNATPEQIVLGLTSNLSSQVLGQIDSIVWSPDSTLNCRTCANPIATPAQTTTFVATIFYTRNGISCSNSAQVTIDVLNSCENGIIYVPNTFSPNGDGINDVFMIRGLAATKIDYFRVWDRWGRLVFEATGGVPNDVQFGWDGNDRQGKKLNPDVYVYTYEIQCINGNIVAGQGNVTLVR